VYPLLSRLKALGLLQSEWWNRKVGTRGNIMR